MAEQTKATTAFLYITIGPASEFIRFGGKTISDNFIELSANNKLVIGRNPEFATLQIYDLVDESSISRTHCSIYFDSEHQCFMLSDEGSSNGTFLNNERINANDAKRLRHGDEIEVGRIWKKGIQFAFAMENKANPEAHKRVILHSEDKNRSAGLTHDFPNLGALLQEKRLADEAQRAIPEITANIYDAILQLDALEELADEGVETLADAAQVFSEQLRASLKEAETQEVDKPVLAESAKYDVFISYGSDNKEVLDSVAKYLSERHGLKVWHDSRLLTGEDWQKGIEKQLGETYCLLVLMSPSAKASAWVQSEIQAAMKAQLAIFPALLEGDAENAIPSSLSALAYTKLTGDKVEAAAATDRLASEIKKTLLELKEKVESS